MTEPNVTVEVTKIDPAAVPTAEVEEERRKERCEHCGQIDSDPKYHIIGPSDVSAGLTVKTYHHDCAASIGHAKASLILKHTNNAKGDDLLKQLKDVNHPVHQAMKDFNAKESEAIEAAVKRSLGVQE